MKSKIAVAVLAMLMLGATAHADTVQWINVTFHGIVTEGGGFFATGSTFSGGATYNPAGAIYNYQYHRALGQVFWYGGINGYNVDPSTSPFSGFAGAGSSVSFYGEAGGHFLISVTANENGTGSFTLSDPLGQVATARGIVTGVPETGSVWLLAIGLAGVSWFRFRRRQKVISRGSSSALRV